jgi:hypothetical protein
MAFEVDVVRRAETAVVDEAVRAIDKNSEDLA